MNEATVNWLPYLMFQACFMTSKMLQFCWNDCSVWAEDNVKEQLSPLSEFTSSWRRQNVQSGLVYRTITGLITLGTQNNSFSNCFSWRIVLFWRTCCRRSLLSSLMAHEVRSCLKCNPYRRPTKRSKYVSRQSFKANC